MLLATAAVLAGEHEPVYQLGASDANRVTSKRLTELTGLAVRQHPPRQGRPRRGHAAQRSCARGSRRCRSTYEQFERWSAPMFKRVADRLIETIDDKLPTLGRAAARGVRRARARRAGQGLDLHRPGQRARRAVQAVHHRPRHRVPLRQHARAVGAGDAGRPGQAAVGAAPGRLAQVLARHPLPGPPEVDVRQARRGVRRQAEVRLHLQGARSSCSRRRSSSTATGPRCG